MKRTASSVALGILVLIAFLTFGIGGARVLFFNQSVAQEAAPAKAQPDPFADRDDESRPQQKTGQATAAEKRDPTDREADSSETVEFKLEQPVGMEFSDTSIQDVVDALSARTHIPIVIDQKGFEDAGIGTDKTITINLKGVQLNKCLDYILDQLEASWTVRDGYVFISTVERLGELTEVRVYNCSDLIEMVPAKPPGDPREQGGFGGGEAPKQDSRGPQGNPAAAPAIRGGGFFAVGQENAAATSNSQEQVTGAFGLGGGIGGGGMGIAAPQLVPDNDSLIDVIQNTIDPDTWTDAGGFGSIEAYHGGLLVISQSGPTHRRIDQLLKMMRLAKKADPGTVFRER